MCTVHLIPGENVAWIDTLDSTPKKVAATDANRTHTHSRESEQEFSDGPQAVEAEEVVWLPPRDSNPDMLIQSRHSADRELLLVSCFQISDLCLIKPARKHSQEVSKKLDLAHSGAKRTAHLRHTKSELRFIPIC
jgi:hypothetical protein